MNKDLSEYTQEELLEELKKRSSPQLSVDEEEEEKTHIYLFGYGHQLNLFETQFIKIEKPEDLKFLSSFLLRIRFNSHRQIKVYTFKTTESSMNLLRKALSIIGQDSEKSEILFEGLKLVGCKELTMQTV